MTIQGKGIRLTEAIQKLQAQSGNAITDLREQMGAEATNPALDLEIVDRPFFEALDAICQQAEVTPNFSTGDGIDRPDGRASRSGRQALVQYSGPFRIAFRQIASRPRLPGRHGQRQRPVRGGVGAAAPARCSWRSRPTSWRSWTTRARKVEPQVMEESADVVLRPENPAAEININLERPRPCGQGAGDGQDQGGGHRPGRHPHVPVPQPRRQATSTQKQGDIAFSLEGTEVDEQVWKVQRGRSNTPARGRRSRATARGCSTTASGSRRPTARASSTTAASRTPPSDERQARLRVPLRRRPRQARRLRLRVRDPEQGAHDPARVRVQGRAVTIAGDWRAEGGRLRGWNSERVGLACSTEGSRQWWRSCAACHRPASANHRQHSASTTRNGSRWSSRSRTCRCHEVIQGRPSPSSTGTSAGRPLQFHPGRAWRTSLNRVRSSSYFWSFWVTLRRDSPLCLAQRATFPLYRPGAG